MDNRKSHIALERLKVSHSIPNFETKAQKLNPPRGPVRLAKRKRISSPVRTKGHSKLHLPKAVKAGVRAHEYVEAKPESPWKSFRKVFKLKINDFVTVATQNTFPCEIVIVKTFETRNKLDMLQQIQDENFVTFLKTFEFQECLYAVFQHITISLIHIIASPPYPTQSQLAAIFGQVRMHFAYMIFAY